MYRKDVAKDVINSVGYFLLQDTPDAVSIPCHTMRCHPSTIYKARNKEEEVASFREPLSHSLESFPETSISFSSVCPTVWTSFITCHSGADGGCVVRTETLKRNMQASNIITTSRVAFGRFAMQMNIIESLTALSSAPGVDKSKSSPTLRHV